MSKRTLPRSAIRRLGLGFASLIFSIIFGLGTVVLLLTPMPPLGMMFTCVLVVTDELFLATTLVSVLGLIWAVATPSWVEKLFRSAWKKLHWAILLAILPLVVLMVLAFFGVKLGAGLGP